MDILGVIVKTSHGTQSSNMPSLLTLKQIHMHKYKNHNTKTISFVSNRNLWLRAYQIYHPMCFKNEEFWSLFRCSHCRAINWEIVAPCRWLAAYLYWCGGGRCCSVLNNIILRSNYVLGYLWLHILSYFHIFIHIWWNRDALILYQNLFLTICDKNNSLQQTANDKSFKSSNVDMKPVTCCIK